MGKNMASINPSSGVVENILWCADSENETDTLKNVQGYGVLIGDVYKNGRWYRKDDLLKDPLDVANDEIERLKEEIAKLKQRP